MDIAQLQRLKVLESEKAKLKKMYAEVALVHHALQDVVLKKALSQAKRMEPCLAMKENHGVSL